MTDEQLKAHKFNNTYVEGINLYMEGKKSESIKLFEKSLTEIESSDDLYVIKINVAMIEDIRKIIKKIKSEVENEK